MEKQKTKKDQNAGWHSIQVSDDIHRRIVSCAASDRRTVRVLVDMLLSAGLTAMEVSYSTKQVDKSQK